ncbi:hypothetical protein C7B65_12160 [Phormidesmis priestleyi ULC007]|uniref:Uncharacterized protein n=1 Tax=Phormidesmis priestleyi ULC007 TaxID=1920490 RepID=A0A2T1DFU3_9CYAN|nr:hypothetical protein C7B65_12160 [Phormidesmis priestleyi ULC007]PZO52199.1 MAG: hypothetical protein DCF14_06945 [Phormidesmis priestleyi]
MALASIDEWVIGFAKLRRIASNLKLRWVQTNLRLLLLSVIAKLIMGRLITMLAIQNSTTYCIATQRSIYVWGEVAAIASLSMPQERDA